jgi:hypothetical protein
MRVLSQLLIGPRHYQQAPSMRTCLRYPVARTKGVFVADRNVDTKRSAHAAILCSRRPGSVRISTWGIADNHIRWIEEAIPIEAEVLTPSQNELRLRVVGANRPQSYVLASPPYVPDRAVSRV